MAQNLGPLDRFSGRGNSPVDTKRSRDFVSEHDQIMQSETAQLRSYVMKRDGQTPEVIFQQASHPDTKEGYCSPISPAVQVRDTNVSMTFEAKENARKKFINVDEFQRTPGARIAEEGSVGYPNRHSGRKDLESAPTQSSYSVKDDPFRDRAERHIYPDSLPDKG